MLARFLMILIGLILIVDSTALNLISDHHGRLEALTTGSNDKVNKGALDMGDVAKQRWANSKNIVLQAKATTNSNSEGDHYVGDCSCSKWVNTSNYYPENNTYVIVTACAKMHCDLGYTNKAACFPGLSTVFTADGNTSILSMAQLGIGNRILTPGAFVEAWLSPPDRNETSDVIAFFHKKSSESHTYLTFLFEATDETLRISGNHLLYAKRDLFTNPRIEFLSADQLVPHLDAIFHWKLGWLQISDIQHVRLSGMYAPLTRSGMLIVDGFHVSAYALHASKEPHPFWAYQAVGRFMEYSDDTYDEQGVSSWASSLMALELFV